MLLHASKNMENSQVPSRLHFWFLGNCLGMELDKKGALPRNLWGKKGLRALNCGVFLVADPVVCLIALNSQPKAY